MALLAAVYTYIFLLIFLYWEDLEYAPGCEGKKYADTPKSSICFCNKEHWSIYNGGKTETDVSSRTTSV